MNQRRHLPKKPPLATEHITRATSERAQHDQSILATQQTLQHRLTEQRTADTQRQGTVATQQL
ncbi:hypothetical protein E4U19_003534 [Claviceps sp. Clav32 group G5]|nr:hypothetical protein E4U19_003534 [Claviceps sp. Clav32 group G5]